MERVRSGRAASDGGAEVLRYMVEWCMLAGDVTEAACFENPLSSHTVENAAGQDGLDSSDIRCPNYPQRKIWEVQTVGDGTNTAIAGTFRLALNRAGNGFADNDPCVDGQKTCTENLAFDALAMRADEASDDAYGGVFCPTTLAGGSNNARACADGVAHGSMQAQLEYLANVAPGSVTVNRRPTKSGASDVGEYIWSITFDNLETPDDFTLVKPQEAETNLDNGSITVTSLTTGMTYDACTGYAVIKQLTTGVNYMARVSAYNSVGYSLPGTPLTYMKPMVAPGKPTSVALTVQSSTELRVTFDPPVSTGGDDVLSYLLEADSSADFDTNAASPQTINGQAFGGEHVGQVLYLDAGAPFVFTFHELSMGVKYYVRVYARNSQGYSPTAISSPSFETPRREPGSPEVVRFLPTSDRKLTVVVDDSTDNGGQAVSYYRVEWDTNVLHNSNQAPPDKGTKVVAVAQHTSVTLNDLSAATYFARASASNDMGYGTATDSSPLQLMPSRQVPGIPTNLEISVDSQKIGRASCRERV